MTPPGEPGRQVVRQGLYRPHHGDGFNIFHCLNSSSGELQYENYNRGLEWTSLSVSLLPFDILNRLIYLFTSSFPFTLFTLPQITTCTSHGHITQMPMCQTPVGGTKLWIRTLERITTFLNLWPAIRPLGENKWQNTDIQSQDKD